MSGNTNLRDRLGTVDLLLIRVACIVRVKHLGAMFAGKAVAYPSEAPYKTFYGRKLRLFIIS